jgi:hypothetical protein
MYDLQNNEYITEVNTIQNILHNNAFPIHPGSTPTQHSLSDITRKQVVTTHTEIPT